MRNIRIIKMEKRIVFSIVIAVIVIAIVIAVLIDSSHKVAFEDETMAELIAKNVGVESVDKLRIEDLEDIETLNIGYTGYYNTLLDIVKCQNLDELVIGNPEYAFCHYHRNGKEIPESESEERVKQIESEMKVILEKCSNIKTLYVSNEKGNCRLNSVEFLKNGNGLELLYIEYQSELDYSFISECKKLKALSLYGSDISELKGIGDLDKLSTLNIARTNISQAEDILKLKKLKYLNITETPLAENEEQVELIQNKFPEIEIQK